MAPDTYLEGGTPIHLWLAQRVTSKKTKVGQRIAFQVADDVSVGGLVAIPRGAMAWGQISHAQSSKMLGKGGKLALELNSVPALTGEQVPLRGATEARGKSQIDGGLVLLAVIEPLLLPLVPLGHGEQAEIRKGMALTAFVKSRVSFDTGRLAAENRALEERLKSPAPRVPGKAVVSIYGWYSHEHERALHMGYLIRVDGKSLVHLFDKNYLTVWLEPGEHILSSDHAELKLQVEKNTEYYVRVTDAVDQAAYNWAMNPLVEPVLGVVSPDWGGSEMYPLERCSRHDIKNPAIVVDGPSPLPPAPLNAEEPAIRQNNAAVEEVSEPLAKSQEAAATPAGQPEVWRIVQTTSFDTCKMADAKGKQVDAQLMFDDDAKNVEILVHHGWGLDIPKGDLIAIPYENLGKFSYEFTKSHWLYIDYHEQNVSKTVVLRLNKNDYQKVLNAVKTHTGKDVQMLGKATKTHG
jgi:hypothetical protein